MKNRPRNVVGAQVRKLRNARDLSQDELAARCNVIGWDISRGTLAKIEAGVRCVSDAELFVLAKALRAGLSDLFPKSERTILERVGSG